MDIVKEWAERHEVSQVDFPKNLSLKELYWGDDNLNLECRTFLFFFFQQMNVHSPQTFAIAVHIKLIATT